MAKINRIQHSFDQELAEQGLKRTYKVEYTEDYKPIHRELIIKSEEYTTERTPWWKQKAPKSKRSKPSKA